jgi:hypothetical protein
MSENRDPYWRIRSRRAAGFAACVALFLISFPIRILYRHHSPRPQWIGPFDGNLLSYTTISLQVLVFILVVVYVANVLRACRGAERIYFLMLLLTVLLEPLRILPAAASTAVLCAQLGMYFVMFIAASRLFFR